MAIRTEISTINLLNIQLIYYMILQIKIYLKKNMVKSKWSSNSRKEYKNHTI